MRMIVLIVLASIVGYGALQIDKIDPDNYVKMYIGHYLIEIKVLGFLLLLLGLVLLLYSLVWLVRSIWRSPKSLAGWRNRRNRNKADEQFGAGYLSLIKGDWRRAEIQLTDKSDYSHIPYVNYLAAARAAQEQSRFSQRDKYLKAAYAAAPNERLAIGLTKAKLHEKAGQVEQAQATLEDISDLAKSNPQYTAMLIQTYQQAKNWPAIQGLLATAKKQRALPTETLTGLQNDIHHNALSGAENKVVAWKALPREQRKRLINIVVYVQDMVGRGENAGAEKLIRATLKQQWSNELVDVYGQLQVDKPLKLLRQVEGWLMAQPENGHLNLAAGRLAKVGGSLDSAKRFLQAAIGKGSVPEAYGVLGEVYEANSENAKALQMYRVGMQVFASGSLDSELYITKLGEPNHDNSPSTDLSADAKAQQG